MLTDYCQKKSKLLSESRWLISFDMQFYVFKMLFLIRRHQEVLGYFKLQGYQKIPSKKLSEGFITFFYRW